MKTQLKTMLGVLAALAVSLAAAPAFASDATGAGDETGMSSGTATSNEQSKPDPAAWHRLVRDAEKSVASFERADPHLATFFAGAVAYAVFPEVGKGGAGIGGAYGRGVLFEHGKPMGQTTLTQVTIGAQLGGQTYSEVVFFETHDALARFKKSELAMSAQASAVVAASGASKDARYASGVAVFTLPRAGLMAEASLGGQRFAYSPMPAR